MSQEPDAEPRLRQELIALRARLAELESRCSRLRSDAQRHHWFVDAADEGLWELDAEQHTVYVNSRMAKILGTSVAELVGASLFEFMDEHGAAECRAILERGRDGVSEQDERELVRRDGTRVRTRIRTAAILDGAGRPEGAVVLVTDVTAQRSVEEELRHQKDDFRLIFDSAPAMIWFKDTENRILRVNKLAAAASGLTVAEIEGRSTYDLFPAQAAAYHKDDLEVIRSNRPKLGIIEPIVVGGGETRWIHTDKIPCRNAQGEAIGVVVFALDVTDAKRAEAEREQMNARLLQTQKLESLGVLAGGIAHDFNNLLVGILGNAGLALMDMPPESPGRSSIEGVRDAAQRAADLARQMLAYSGRGKFVVEHLDLSRLVDEMSHLLSAVISKKAVLKLNTNARLPAIEGDATQLRQVIMNLITNASDAVAERSGIITVTTGVMHADAEYLASTYIHDHLPEGYYVFVEVSDTGSGMDAETMARMFEPFYTTKFTGRGLGLSALLGILRSHQGAIRVYSEIGRGTTIKILLPAVQTPAEAITTERTDLQSRHAVWRGAGTVLVVDDEEMVRAVTKSVLERAGFTVLTAADGRAALATFRDHRAEIVAILLDMTMPHLSGEETYRELRRIDPDVRVVLTSGYSEQDATERFAGRGLAGFVRKPSTPQELIASMRAVLEG